jgi:hypothetical protein
MRRFAVHIVVSCVCLASGLEAQCQDLAGMGIKKGIKASGGVTLSNIVYATNDSVSRRDPYQAILSGNLNLNIFGYDTPFSFIYSNSQRSYTQPFNRLSFTPTYKWIRAYIGQTSMTFSPYTLSGHSFRGAGVELTPGNWRFAMMGGRLKKAVEFNPLSESVQPSYKRMGYGAKFGWENASSGIIVNVFSAKDQENSLRKNPENIALHPMENLAAGISGHTSTARGSVMCVGQSVGFAIVGRVLVRMFATLRRCHSRQPFACGAVALLQFPPPGSGSAPVRLAWPARQPGPRHPGSPRHSPAQLICYHLFSCMRP